MPDTKAFSRAKWFVLSLLAIVFFFTFCYTDIIETQTKGIYFFQGLFSGRFSDLYHYESVFYIPIHIIFGIWCLPIAVLELIGIHAMDTVFTYLWSKLLVMVFGVGCILVYRKLLKMISCGDLDFWTFFLCASPLFWGSLLVIAQYDVIELFFGMLAIFLSAKEGYCSWKSFIFMSIAISCKLIFAFGAILLLLVREKRLLYLFRDIVVIMIIPTILFLLFHPFAFASNGGDMSTVYASAKFSLVSLPGLVDMPFFYLVFFADCAIAFFYMKPGNEREYILNIAWLMTSCYSAFILMVDLSHPSWAILIVPFLLLLLAGDQVSQVKNAFLGAVFQLSIFIIQVYIFDWVYLTKDCFQFLLLRNCQSIHLFGKNIARGSTLMDKFGLNQFVAPLASFSLILIILLLFQNNPWYSAPTIRTGVGFMKAGKTWVTWILLVFMTAFLLLSIIISLLM